MKGFSKSSIHVNLNLAANIKIIDYRNGLTPLMELLFLLP
jgi:hypothetical protein